MINQNNIRPVETILLAKDLTPIEDGNTKLVDANKVNLADGQLGVFSASALNKTPLNQSIDITAAIDTNDSIIQIVQGTDAGQNFTAGRHPLVDTRPYVTSGQIDLKNDTIITSRVAKEEEFSTWIVGKAKNAGSTVGEINIADEAEYSMSIAFDGQVLDLENSSHAKLVTTISFTALDYNDLSIVDNAAKDHIVQNFAYKLNRNSRAFFGGSIWGANLPLVAFAVSTSDATAPNTETGTEKVDIRATALDNGGLVKVFKRNNVTHSIQLTKAQVLSLREAIPSGSSILVIDLDQAMTKGASANMANHFVVMALDRDLAYEDRAPLTKIRLDIGLPRGFASSVNTEHKVKPFEGEGKGRVWNIFYTNTAGQRIYAQYQRQEFPFIEVPSGIDNDAKYDVIIIEHRSYAEIDPQTTSVSPKRTYILAPEGKFVAGQKLDSLVDYLEKAIVAYPRVRGMKDGAGSATLH